MLDLLKTLPQYLLPKRLLSVLMHWIMNIEQRQIKNLLITGISRLYDIDTTDAIKQDRDDFKSFNAFFTRAMKPEARPIEDGKTTIISPADGTVSQMNIIDQHTLLQAKGQNYDLINLLAGNVEQTLTYENGQYCVVYLSPKDYHRVHMPADGTIEAMTYVPGTLFAVNGPAVRQIPRLFTRNERVIVYCRSTSGTPFVVILVGAIFVGSMETVWHGKITPPYGNELQHWVYEQPIALNKGDELGRFNMGSTVVMLFPPASMDFEQDTGEEASIRMGEKLANWR